MPRRVYDAQDLAIGMTERFKDRPWEYQEELPFSWPTYMQNVGDSLAVAYDSDKWKPKGNGGKREGELYKHLAESRNRALVQPGLLRLFEEINLQLFTKGTNRSPAFSDDKDEGVVGVRVRHGMLGGSYIRWSELYDNEKDQPFLFVYTRAAGVCIIVVGDDLDVHKDGIVG
jgi:hypothetical protein